MISSGIFLSCGRDVVTNYDHLVVADKNISLQLVTSDPIIATPIGLAIDDKDQLYILESHTHSPESDYQGPKFDRIKKSSGMAKDGTPTSWMVFADSIEDGMNLAYHDITIFLVTKNKVLAFKDQNGDGISDERKTLLTMDPPTKVYDHAGLLGIAISADGWIYVSRGNIGGQRYKITGSDGSTLENFGDGGNVFRIHFDGSQLEEVATGFWNPFGLEISKKGALWLTDNDPDSRGPNRMIELVMGGDFGYRSLYGGSGIHPFSAWNGELPGTLPYYAGIGEAPCGMIDASFTNLPSQYADHLLVAIWEENKIISVPLNGRTTNDIKSEMLIQGDSTFHPVAFASNSRGDIYFTDWVVRQYPNHGHGKIWKIEVAKDKRNIMKASDKDTANIWRDLKTTISQDSLIIILSGSDQQLKTVTRQLLSQPRRTALLTELINSEQAALRLQALLTYFQINTPLSVQSIKKLLEDADPEIRMMTLIYIAKKSRSDLRDQVLASLTKHDFDAPSFSVFLETIRQLHPDFVEALAQADSRYDPGLTRKLDDDYIFDLIENQGLSVPIRILALSHLVNPSAYLQKILHLFNSVKNNDLRLALIETVKKVKNDTLAQSLLATISNEEENINLRIKSLQALTFQTKSYCNKISALLHGSDDQLTEPLLRHLGNCLQEPDIKSYIDDYLAKYRGTSNLRNIWQLYNGTAVNRPASDQEWLALLNQRGNAKKGKVLFETPKIQCQTCHSINGWGGNFGPDLAHVGSSKSEKQLAQAILNPSSEVAPEWQGWIVVDSIGTTHLGWQIDVGRHDVELINQEGEFITYRSPQKYAPSEASLMPENLENNLTTEDFRDLVSYLVSLK